MSLIEQLNKRKLEIEASNRAEWIELVKAGASESNEPLNEVATLATLERLGRTVEEFGSAVDLLRSRFALVAEIEAAQVAAGEIPAIAAEVNALLKMKDDFVIEINDKIAPLEGKIAGREAKVLQGEKARAELIRTAGDAHRVDLIEIDNERELASRNIRGLKDELERREGELKQAREQLANYSGPEREPKEKAIAIFEEALAEKKTEMAGLRKIVDTGNDRYLAAQAKLLLNPLAI